MKNKLSIIILLHLFLLLACSTNKNGLSNNHLNSQKLTSIQVIKPDLDNVNISVGNNKNLVQKTDTNSTTTFHSNALITNSSSPKVQFNKSLVTFKSLQMAVKHELKDLSASPSYIASVAPQSGNAKNPYIPPLLTFMGVEIIYAIIFGLAIYGIGPGVVGGIIFIFIIAIAIITFVILALATKPENYNSSLTISYFLAWFLGFIATAFPLMMFYYGIPLIIPSMLLFIVSCIFFVLWLKHLGENQVHDASKPVKRRKLAYLLVSIGALAAAWLISLISLSLPGPILFYLLILFALTIVFSFVLWLVKTCPLKSKAS